MWNKKFVEVFLFVLGYSLGKADEKWADKK